MTMKYKLTAIFRACVQDGTNHYSDHAYTRNIPLTEEQQKLLTPAENSVSVFSELILEEDAVTEAWDKRGADTCRITTNTTPLEDHMGEAVFQTKRILDCCNADYKSGMNYCPNCGAKVVVND